MFEFSEGFATKKEELYGDIVQVAAQAISDNPQEHFGIDGKGAFIKIPASKEMFHERKIPDDIERKEILFRPNGEVQLVNAGYQPQMVSKASIQESPTDKAKQSICLSNSNPNFTRNMAAIKKALKEANAPHRMDVFQNIETKNLITRITFNKQDVPNIKVQKPKQNKNSSEKFKLIFSEVLNKKVKTDDKTKQEMQRAPEEEKSKDVLLLKEINKALSDCEKLLVEMCEARQSGDNKELANAYGKLKDTGNKLIEKLERGEEEVPLYYQILARKNIHSIQQEADAIMSQQNMDLDDPEKKNTRIKQLADNGYIIHIYHMMCMKENLEAQTLLNTIAATNGIGSAEIYAGHTKDAKMGAITHEENDSAMSDLRGDGHKTDVGSDTIANDENFVNDILENGPQTWSMDAIHDAAQYGREHREKALAGVE